MAEVAHRFGFAELERFSETYQATFGEALSTTLQHTPGLRPQLSELSQFLHSWRGNPRFSLALAKAMWGQQPSLAALIWRCWSRRRWSTRSVVHHWYQHAQVCRRTNCDCRKTGSGYALHVHHALLRSVWYDRLEGPVSARHVKRGYLGARGHSVMPFRGPQFLSVTIIASAG
jgi:hypothetical protein